MFLLNDLHNSKSKNFQMRGKKISISIGEEKITTLSSVIPLLTSPVIIVKELHLVKYQNETELLTDDNY